MYTKTGMVACTRTNVETHTLIRTCISIYVYIHMHRYICMYMCVCVHDVFWFLLRVPSLKLWVSAACYGDMGCVFKLSCGLLFFARLF